MDSKSGGVRTTGAVGPKCSAISSWGNGALVLNALRSQLICLPTGLSGIVTVRGCLGGGDLCAVVRGLCRIRPGSTCGEGEYRCGGKCHQRERATLPACVFEFHGLISSAFSSARVRLRCRRTQPEVLNRFILEYRQLLVVVTRIVKLDKTEKCCTRVTFVRTARVSSWSRPGKKAASTVRRSLRGDQESGDRTDLPTPPS